jgi:thiamine biosynthesis protein ThiS
MKINVNGQAQEVPENLNVIELLAHLKLNAARIAIERNLGVLPRHKWNETPVAAGDSYEIVQLVGGG